ncbi:GIY-YIG nuclease family protein [Aromatoleum bremense]|uniref:GIY-YIG nuclease family protein n=1 Tax=Aromatoleum bremense TaxID=76115 RepID=A0ABX1P0W9_9RHOO|nr:GIY-YIG nuclease family protein [Aromatoleum bremense]NMG17636.1 hypothetical protein [Aromatoleum bremense]QTQ33607.1 Uncharacterized protein pbN1_36220 [Aromatoleum bremense]
MKKLWRKLWGRPLTDAGHVYYVRLNTSQGILYKLGFTTRGSVKERFSYAGFGDEKLIDKIFFFAYRQDAYLIEQKLHKHFKKCLAFGQYSNDPNLPLCNRGQGELYRSDILGLDDELYVEEVAIRHEAAKNDLEGCLMILLILVGVVGVPLGGWGIPVLLGAGFWYFIASSKEAHQQIVSAGVRRKPDHPVPIGELIDALSRSREGKYPQ